MKIVKYAIVIVNVLAVAIALLYPRLYNKVNSKKIIEMYVFRPRTISEAHKIYTAMQKGKLCIVDLTDADTGNAQRITDYIAGISIATNNNVHHVSKRVIAVLPNRHR